MAGHKLQSAWLAALGLLTALLWTTQFAADWYVPHSNTGIAELDKIELALVIHPQSSDSSRAFQQESKPDPVPATAAFFATAAIQTDRSLATFAAENSRRELLVVLPGIRAPPHFHLSA